MSADDLSEKQLQRVLTAVARYHEAMVAAHVADLSDMLEPEYFLIHITGYRQPKQEWLSVVRSGAYDYHRIDVNAKELQVHLGSESAVVSGRGVFDATIQGMHAPWRLKFKLELTKGSSGWKLSRARYDAF
ncbi:nuclear transport factor 2 family protein [Pseudomonas sp. RIT-To-2]|uniref:nuclear transport factor 2 family protein n=1 Tax=Pseudomonas sp. RIT-To-2 TaxID=3462541 RepID=UPI002413017D